MSRTPDLAVPARHDITGLVLAGGRGTRLGGVDKGLQPWRGRPLVDHVLARFSPQVGTVLLSANRHLDDYARRGWPVLADADDAFDGPLAGILAALRRATTPWLAVVPCDAPALPVDLVARLAARAGAGGAYAEAPEAGGPPRAQPLCCLVHAGPDAADAVAARLAQGRRQVMPWLRDAGAVPVLFDAPGDAGAFANLNRPEDLAGAA